MNLMNDGNVTWNTLKAAVGELNAVGSKAWYGDLFGGCKKRPGETATWSPEEVVVFRRALLGEELHQRAEDKRLPQDPPLTIPRYSLGAGNGAGGDRYASNVKLLVHYPANGPSEQRQIDKGRVEQVSQRLQAQAQAPQQVGQPMASLEQYTAEVLVPMLRTERQEFERIQHRAAGIWGSLHEEVSAAHKYNQKIAGWVHQEHKKLEASLTASLNTMSQ